MTLLPITISDSTPLLFSVRSRSFSGAFPQPNPRYSGGSWVVRRKETGPRPSPGQEGPRDSRREGARGWPTAARFLARASRGRSRGAWPGEEPWRLARGGAVRGLRGPGFAREVAAHRRSTGRASQPVRLWLQARFGSDGERETSLASRWVSSLCL
jgi:hypothetical protein